MKIKKHTKNTKKVPIIISVIVVVGILAFLAYLFIFKPHTDGGANSTTTTKSSDQQQSENLTENPDTKTTNTNTDTPAEPTTKPGSNKKQVEMVTSTDQSAGFVYIRGGINYPVSGGSCYALLTGPSGQSIRKESTVLPNPASSDCKTISISIGSDLASGRWTYTLHYTSDEYEGVSSETSFDI